MSAKGHMHDHTAMVHGNVIRNMGTNTTFSASEWTFRARLLDDDDMVEDSGYGQVTTPENVLGSESTRLLFDIITDNMLVVGNLEEKNSMRKGKEGGIGETVRR